MEIPTYPDVDLTDRQRMFALFDAAASCRAVLELHDADEPEAPTALALWASARGVATHRTGGDDAPRLSVTDHYTIVITMRPFSRAA